MGTFNIRRPDNTFQVHNIHYPNNLPKGWTKAIELPRSDKNPPAAIAIPDALKSNVKSVFAIPLIPVTVNWENNKITGYTSIRRPDIRFVV